MHLLSPSAPVNCSGLRPSRCNTAVTSSICCQPSCFCCCWCAALPYRLVILHHHKGRIRCCLHAKIHCKLLCWIHCWQLHLQSTAETYTNTAVAPGVPAALAVCFSMPNVHVTGAVHGIKCIVSKITNVRNCQDFFGALITAHSVAADDDELFTACYLLGASAQRSA